MGHDDDATPRTQEQLSWKADDIALTISRSPGQLHLLFEGPCFAACLVSMIAALRPHSPQYSTAGWYLPIAAEEQLRTWYARHLAPDAVKWVGQ